MSKNFSSHLYKEIACNLHLLNKIIGERFSIRSFIRYTFSFILHVFTHSINSSVRMTTRTKNNVN